MVLTLKEKKIAVFSGLLSFFLYISGFFVLLTPLPLFYLSLKEKGSLWQVGLASASVLAFLFYFFLFPYFTEGAPLGGIRFFNLTYFGYYLLISYALSHFVWKRWPFVRLGPMALFVAGALFLWLLFAQAFGIFDILGALRQSVEEALKLLEKSFSSDGVEKGGTEAALLMESMKRTLHFFPNLIPSLVFIFSLLIMGLNLGLLRLFLRQKESLGWIGEFKDLQIPQNSLWVLIGSGTVFFLDYYLIREVWLAIVAVNIFISAAFVYFLQGLSIVAYFLRRYSFLFRFGIYGLLFLFFQLMSVVVLGVGVADTWLDFRKLRRS